MKLVDTVPHRCGLSPRLPAAPAEARIGRIALALALLIGMSARPASATAYAYIANGDSPSVGVIDTDTHQVVARIPLPGTCQPRWVAVHPDGLTVYVTDRTCGRLVFIDAVTNTEFDRRFINNELRGVAVHPDGSELYVASAREEPDYTHTAWLTALDSVSRDVIFEVELTELGPYAVWGVAVDASGLVYVTRDNPTISLVDPAVGLEIGLITGAVGQARSVAMNFAGSRLFVGGYGLTAIDTASQAVLETLDAYPNAFSSGLAVHPDGSRLYVAAERSILAQYGVLVVDTATAGFLGWVPLEADPWGVAVHPDGETVWVTTPDTDSVSVIDTATRQVIDVVAVGDWPVSEGPFIGPDLSGPLLSLRGTCPDFRAP